ncbi:hypothetical protein A2Y85_07095 [candidate division WOR-3 bacterium RBG_13_43_14]|uniref:Insertion element IS150 protein InsJ-like helix-turn-helix domain-containing protein n=1 Tax=candidate division WOR-3 bacterium RBG_13_43_14 TaxID=1802590 RepID=A0A1F4UEX2_UNCW3|nr:MAG: hypothetical protein A2Y85_07095 [candidate division WOR-3 bacterium RBG_13_43_14]
MMIIDILLQTVYNFPQMYNKGSSIRQEVVESYFNNNGSLRKTAREYGLHYQTVYKWVKLSRKKGIAGLLSTYQNPWNRIDRILEEHIVLIKEKYPGIILKMARQILAQDNIEISLKGIMSVWKRYGYAGYNKKNYCNEFIEYVNWSQEAKNSYRQAKNLFAAGNIKESAAILNTIPVLPKNSLITEIPDNMLSLRRRIEKASVLFGVMSLPDYLALVQALYRECVKQHLHHSALRIGLLEIATLAWSGKINEQLIRIAELKKFFHLYPGMRPERRTGLLFEPYFTLLIGEAMAYAHNLEIRKGNKIANQCARLLKTHDNISPGFMTDLGILYSNLEEYAKAEFWFNRASQELNEDKRKNVNLYRAYQIGFAKCDLVKGYALLRKSTAIDWVHNLWRMRLRSLFALVQGNPSKSISLATECLTLSKKSELRRDIFNTFLTIACAYSSLGEKKKARLMLGRLLPHLTKTKLIKQISLTKLLLRDNLEISKEMRSIPSIRLLQLIKEHKYLKSLHYARKRGILGYFYRFVLFFPGIVHTAIEHGESLSIPKSILRLPVFNSSLVVCDVKFLGNTIFHRNRKYVKLEFSPKETAFLIHLALKSGEPAKRIGLHEVYDNFWPGRVNPARNLSHMLVRIKKGLKIPPHLIEISRRGGESVLINRGLHLITDYNEFEQTLAAALAFERAGEWKFARKEHRRAFRLFRGEPFRKMYDPWSEQMRLVILSKLETGALHFVESCRGYKDRRDAEKILKRISEVVPAFRVMQPTFEIRE